MDDKLEQEKKGKRRGKGAASASHNTTNLSPHRPFVTPLFLASGPHINPAYLSYTPSSPSQFHFFLSSSPRPQLSSLHLFYFTLSFHLLFLHFFLFIFYRSLHIFLISLQCFSLFIIIIFFNLHELLSLSLPPFPPFPLHSSSSSSSSLHLYSFLNPFHSSIFVNMAEGRRWKEGERKGTKKRKDGLFLGR